MYKLIFDSDALIKLIKAKLPKKVFKSLKVLATNEVYDECVVEGKKAFFEDAFIIETLVKEGFIEKVQVRKNPKIQNLLRNEHFGKGEESVLHLYQTIKAGVICSDDERFLNFLDKNNFNFTIPADFIVRLKETNLLSKEEASKILGELKPFIKEHIYFKFKKQIGEKI
mgnify:CR=1 FL=1